jgi:hypothetical protein
MSTHKFQFKEDAIKNAEERTGVKFDLLPCPHCAHSANLSDPEKDPNTWGGYRWVIVCSSSHCRASVDMRADGGGFAAASNREGVMLNKEMQRALEADGEKLRAVTGKDHGPKFGTELSDLRQAIIDHTKGDLFWIGEILLAELEKETGFGG